jgi:predicted neutral ceramidase superfamily lipid hydrolase
MFIWGLPEMILVPRPKYSHTQGMSLKNAAFLAFISTLLLSVLMLWRLVMDILNVSQGLIPAQTLLASLIYAFAAVTVAAFFFVFQSSQR